VIYIILLCGTKINDMKKLSFILLSVFLFSCQKEEINPLNQLHSRQKDLITKYCESNLRGYSIDQQTGIYYRVTKKGDLTKSIYGQFGIGIKYIGKYIYWDENHIDGVKGTIFDALPQPYENQLIYIRSPFENIFMSLYKTGGNGFPTVQQFVLKTIGVGGEMDVVVPCYMDGNNCKLERLNLPTINESPLHYYIRL
jgi:hypothetical protein